MITILLILACAGTYFLVQPSGNLLGQPTTEQALDDAEFTFRNAAIPCEVLKGRPLTAEEIRRTLLFNDDSACGSSTGNSDPVFPEKNVLLSVLVSMFLHGGFLHLGGNMLFLWVFGNNVEDTWGPGWYVIFYLAAGVAATLGHIAVQPNSTVPLVGASGALAGVMGAYLVLFPHIRITSLIFLGVFITTVDIPAKWFLIFWFGSQFFILPSEGIAWMAHVAGFVFGVVMGAVAKVSDESQQSPFGSGPISY